jgi:hypothetical protein
LARIKIEVDIQSLYALIDERIDARLADLDEVYMDIDEAAKFWNTTPGRLRNLPRPRGERGTKRLYKKSDPDPRKLLLGWCCCGGRSCGRRSTYRARSEAAPPHPSAARRR